MLWLRLSCLLCLFTADVQASNHWYVTEAGLIQAKEKSPYVLATPDDLLTFLNQASRWENIFNMYEDLYVKQLILNKMWSELEDHSHFSTDISENEYCKAAGDLDAIDWYTSFLEDGKNMGIPSKEFILYAIEEFADTEVPDCKKISSLTFSMSTFEHLESIVNRGHLSGTPELTLPAVFSSVWTVNQYGHWLSQMLRKNTTSWLHYNLAAIYWRIKGNVHKALECSRRAVHHAPRYYKAIPLLCMGSILHRSKQVEDAIVVLGAAVDHAPTFPYSHFTLAKAYAMAGEYNSSIKHLNATMKLRQDFEFASKYYNAVLCHIDMFTKMQYVRRKLKELKNEIEEILEIETEWFKVQVALLKSMHHDKPYNPNYIERNCIKVEEIASLKIKELHVDRDRNCMIYFIVNHHRYKEWMNEKGVNSLNIAYELEKVIQNIVIKTGMPNITGYDIPPYRNKTKYLDDIGPLPTVPDVFPDQMKYSFHVRGESFEIDPETGRLTPGAEKIYVNILKNLENSKVLYPSSMVVNRYREDFDVDPDWPSNMFCQKAKLDTPEHMEAVYPVFMPFEHKGISLGKILTEKIGLTEFEEHDLPWHPPLCPSDRDLPLYSSKKGTKVQIIGETSTTETLRQRLLSYVSHENYAVIKGMQDVEIGQRIYAAMQKKLASKWVLYTLASLYWRVRGNTANALNCLLTASRTADTRYRDVVLVSLSSVLLESGLSDDALLLAEEAYKMNPYEPPTNFLLAQIHIVKQNTRTMLFHLKQTLRVSPTFLGGHVRRLLQVWACFTKQVDTLRDMEVKTADLEADNEFCADTDPGHSMVCERDGTNCRLTNRKCQPDGRASTSAILQLMELKNEQTRNEPSDSSEWTFDKTFVKYVNHVPQVRYDKEGHQKSYDIMVKMFADLVAGCHRASYHLCGVNFEEFTIQPGDCSKDTYNPEYWLQIICFKNELNELEVEMTIELATTTPSNKRVPECRIPPDATEDFYISRILAVDSSGWVKIHSLMQQIGNLHRHIDFELLGAKISKYIENNPTSWVGALVGAWWCGAGGLGPCAVRCAASAHALLPLPLAPLATRRLAALLHLQSKPEDALNIAFLSFYTSPKSALEATVLGLILALNDKRNEALWMFRYAAAFKNFDNLVPLLSIHNEVCSEIEVIRGIESRKNKD